MKRYFKIFSLLLILLLAGGCDVLTSDSDGIEYAEGTVYYIGLEGGFYGIIATDDRKFDPLNLPEEFRADSLKVSFLYKYADSQVSYHMWGSIIEIVEINRR